MALHLATVHRPASVPVEQVHVMLYSYFPEAQRGAPRPFVWRLLSRDRVAMLSASRPRSPDAREVTLPVGTTLDFALTLKRVRNSTGERYQGRSGARRRRHEPVEITDPVELRERIIRYAGERGVAVGYLRVEAMGLMRIVKGGRPIALPIAHVAGQALVTDAERAAAMLASGGPGTGRAYGLGMWWLPQIMGGHA